MGAKEFKVYFLSLSFSVLLICSPGLFFNMNVLAETSAEPSCISEKCHNDMGKAKFVHGPVAIGECTSCHKPVSSHTFEPINDVGELCYKCHNRLNSQKTVHKPVREGKCTGCHSPHQSPNKFQLLGAGPDLCFRCHDRKLVAGKFVHGPASVGDCRACHHPHQSDNPKMLLVAGNDLCFSCHSEKADELKSSKVVHPPVRSDCVGCHSPHSSNYKYNLLAEPTRDLCFTCHIDKKEETTAALVKHGGLETEKKCLACHTPHFSNNAKLLVMNPGDLCLSCHDREYTKASGKIADIKNVLAKNKDWHGPVREKDCSSCHNPHGSNNFRMLREYYPQIFYDSYNINNYKLCFMCHEKSIANDEFTMTMTGFRNGSQNLHFVHVNRQKGRTCRACHDPHATNNPSHIRDSVPFGTWPLPVNFTKTKTGGQCSPGCHQMFMYDRNKPAKNR
jgi:predicted CXXCH cytochrome family protein